MTPELLSAVAGVLLSLAFSYIPGLNTKYAALSDEWKKLTMLGLLLVVAAGTFGLACAGLLTDLFGMTITCDKAGAIGLVQVFLFAAFGNQTAYKLTPQTQAVKALKLGRG